MRREAPSHSTHKGSKRYRYYVCSAARKRGWQVCPSRSIPAGEVEAFVVDQIRAIGRDPKLVAETARQARSQVAERLAELETEEQRLGRELAGHQRDMQMLIKQLSVTTQETWRRKWPTSRIGCERPRRRLIELRDKHKRLDHELIDDTEAAKAMAAFDPLWETLNFREQARLLQLLIERIEYDRHKGTISITFLPSGIKALANRDFSGDAA